MATGNWNTSEEEDAAIAAVAQVTPSAFVAERLQHQLRFVVEQHRQQQQVTVAERYAALPPDEKAAVDAVLERNRAVIGKRR